MVNQAETDRRMYAESVAYAQRDGRSAFADQLAAIGPPPYDNMLDYPVAIASNPEWHEFERAPDHSSRSSYPMNLFVPEFTLTEQVRSASALVDTFATLYPQLQASTSAATSITSTSPSTLPSALMRPSVGPPW